jgi:hypothetical protein
VTGLGSGTATITATSEGKSATAAVTVQAAPPAGTVPAPTLLPVAAGQLPNLTAYAALNLPAQAAGFSYTDPVSGTRIWKATSATLPTTNIGAGKDYAEGGNQVSRGWGAGNNTHTLLIRGDASSFQDSNMGYYLVDFTRGVGFANYRRLSVQPRRDLCATFSNVVGQERILFIMTGPQVVRYNTATMAVENTGVFPVTLNGGADAFGWLHQDKSDTWFTVMTVNNVSIAAFNTQTGQFLTYTPAPAWGRMEPRLERDGRFVAVIGGSNGPLQYWDLTTNSLGPIQQAGSGTAKLRLSHGASLRSYWSGENDYTNFDEDRYVAVPGTGFVKTQISTASPMGSDSHESGNWIQDDAPLGGNLLLQWTMLYGIGSLSGLSWNQAIGYLRIDGGDQPRLLTHHYSTPVGYFDYPMASPSPDGKIVAFNSNMLSAGRYDLFVAEVPLR